MLKSKDSIFKEFNVYNSTYIFSVNDFEIFRINQTEATEKALKKIKEKKIRTNESCEIENLKIEDFKKSLYKVVGIDVVNGCNLACSYCFISATLKKKKALSKELFVDILNFLKNQKNEPIVFYFAGSGEPTLNFNLLKQLPSLCEENGFKNFSFDLTTNGTVLTKKKIEFFKNNRFKISISLDGDENVNDTSRIYRNGKGSFKDIYKNILLLKNHNIEFTCKTVLDPSNKNIFDTFSFFEENKIKFNFAIVTHSFDGHFEPNINDLHNFEQQMDLLIDRYTILIKSNHEIFAKKISNDLKRIHFGNRSEYACDGSLSGIYIDIEGNIFPCTYHMSSKDLSIGDIYNGVNYEKIMKMKWYAQSVNKYEACKNCWMKYLCAGSCFAIKWLENNNTEAPSSYLCKTYDIYWRAIIKLYIKVYPEIISNKNINFIDRNIEHVV